MSADIDILVEHPDGYRSTFEVGNMTTNVNRMLQAASGTWLQWFNGVTCEKALPVLKHAWQQLKRHPDLYRRLENPEWGALADFLPYLTRFYVLVRLHKTGTIRVHA